MKQRTKFIQIRLTEEEIKIIREKSTSYCSLSHFVRSAIAEFSNIDVKQKLCLLEELGTFYRDYRTDLAHIGGNLNQTVKRANELAVAGLLSSSYIYQVLLPEIEKTRKALDSFHRQLLSLTKKATSI